MLKPILRSAALPLVGSKGRAELGQRTLVAPIPVAPCFVDEVVHKVGHSEATYVFIDVLVLISDFAVPLLPFPRNKGGTRGKQRCVEELCVQDAAR